MASSGSDYAPRTALERTVSAIASARRAALADRYATNALEVEWRALTELEPIADEWRELAAHALEPNVFYEPAFALAAAPVLGRGAGAVLFWSGTAPRKLLGLFPGRIVERRYGLPLPVLVGWTHPYAPLGTPLVEREAAEPVISAWLTHLAENAALPALLLLPLVSEDGPFAAALSAALARAAAVGCRRLPWRGISALCWSRMKAAPTMSSADCRATGKRNCGAPRGVSAISVRCCSRRRLAIHRRGRVKACRRG